jgi:hypothetical protein
MKKFLLAIALFATIGISGSIIKAQVPPPGAGDRSLRDESDGIKNRSNEIERIRRDADKPADRSTPTLNFAQIKEDFERLQILNNDVLQPTATAATPDYKEIAEAAAEMKKRSHRLRSNLFPGSKEPKTKPSAENQDLKSLYADIDKAMASFVQSPLFHNTSVVDPNDSAKAEADLVKIMLASGKLAKEAEALKKAETSKP